MTASEAEARAFLGEGASLAVKVTSGVSGAVVGAVMAGPPGAVLGAALSPFLEHSLMRLVTDFSERHLSTRQRSRAAASVLLLAGIVATRKAAGATLRDDDFFEDDDTGRKPVDELLEQSIQSAIASVEERRLPYLAGLYASICFDKTVSRAGAATLSKLAETMTYRRLCLLRVLGDGQLWTGFGRRQGPQPEWPEDVHIIARDADALVTDGVLVLKRHDDPGLDSNTAYLDIEPRMLQLGAIGRGLFDRMDIGRIEASDEVVHEVQSALDVIADSPSPNTFDSRL